MAKLMYRDAANYKTLLTLPLPKHLRGKVEIGDDINVKSLGYRGAKHFVEKEVGGYSQEFDHPYVQLLEIDLSDFNIDKAELKIKYNDTY
jgi:hypothetical protein